MQYFQRLESGDKIFFIDDENQIKEVELRYEHLKEDQKRSKNARRQISAEVEHRRERQLHSVDKSHISRRNGMGRMSCHETMV